jgi:hypothetical protein
MAEFGRISLLLLLQNNDKYCYFGLFIIFLFKYNLPNDTARTSGYVVLNNRTNSEILWMETAVAYTSGETEESHENQFRDFPNTNEC